MSFSWRRVRAVVGKELRDLRRNRFVVLTMAVLPLVFLVAPTAELLALPAAASSGKLDARIGLSLLYLLVVPTVVPSTLSAYAIVGEREQGTLEPLLTTPVRADELLVGKALASLLPALVIAYAMFGLFLLLVGILAHPAVASAVDGGSHLLVQLLFTPLLSGWSIWVGVGISTRSNDVRSAQQLAVFGSLPPLAVVALLSIGTIAPSLALALGCGGALLLVDLLGWRVVAALFDRERLLVGRRASA